MTWGCTVPAYVLYGVKYIDIVHPPTHPLHSVFMLNPTQDATVKLYDLRKIVNFHTIEMEAGNKINSIAFDHSGNYLMASGSHLDLIRAPFGLYGVKYIDPVSPPTHTHHHHQDGGQWLTPWLESCAELL